MKNIAYRIFYIGAPYGVNEQGAVVGTHKTSAGALKKWQELQKQGRYYNNLTIRDKDGVKIDIAELV